MAITIDGGTNIISGLAVGGLPDGVVDEDMLASNAVSSGKLASGAGGKCLQVVQDTLTDVFSTNATSYTAITGLSVTITPTSGSKILLMGFIGYGGQSAANIFMGLFRDSTELLVGDAYSSAPRSFAQFAGRNTNSQAGFSPMYLDTHGADGSTAITYTVKTYSEGSSYYIYVNRCQEDNGSTMARTASTLMAIEIGA